MGTIDFERFLLSFIGAMRECRPMTTNSLPSCIKKALNEQGVYYKDGTFVKTQRNIAAEAKENGYGESEDEKTRKALISFLKSPFVNENITDEKVAPWLAWLEKQKSEEINVRALLTADRLAAAEMTGRLKERKDIIENPQKYGLENQGGIDNCPLEGSADCVTTDSRKQGEQNHSEQDLEMVAKPKFNIGDWIVSDLEDVNEDFRLCKIIGIEDGWYTIQSANGCKGYNFFETWESDYHLWSIEDAKDGDVLIDHCDDYKNPLIFILKKFERVDFGLAQKSDYSSYCFLSMNDKPRFKEGYFHHMKDIKPATKEQRDILFTKMHEAGYTFDFEKKELKKLKFRVGDEVITENEESLTITRIDEEGYWSNDLFICDFDSECSWDLVEQKTTEWSLPYGKNETAEKLIALAEILEMDGDCLFNGVSGNSYGKFLRVLAKELTEPKQEWKQENREELTEFENAMMHIGGSFFGENAGLDPNDTDTIKEQAGLLLELAPKTEWSEEDEKMLNEIDNTLFEEKSIPNVKYWKFMNWLKSIKQRYTWKPSKEQIRTLEYYMHNLVCSEHKEVLFGLYEQLKKLKGE